MIEKQKELHMKTNHRKWIDLGYLIIFMLIGIIGYSWYCEWDEVEKLELAASHSPCNMTHKH